MIILSCTIILYYSCSISSLFSITIQHLSTKSMDEVLISTNIFQSELLSWHPRYWLLKYWCRILLTIWTNCQELFCLATSQIDMLTTLKDVKSLVLLSIIFVNYQCAKCIFILTNVQYAIGCFWFYCYVLFD